MTLLLYQTIIAVLMMFIYWLTGIYTYFYPVHNKPCEKFW